MMNTQVFSCRSDMTLLQSPKAFDHFDMTVGVGEIKVPVDRKCLLPAQLYFSIRSPEN